MSVNASKLNLNQLVFRHLKENGFHSAAEELQRHSPQGEADTSVSLLDIYKSWLKDSKKKKQKSAKRSSPGEKGKVPTKGVTRRKKTDKPVKSQAKTSVQKQRKKGEKKSAENVVKARKLKLDAADKAVAAGGEDSDSDSSLDVEKWKKLVLQMTEADLAKMETFNTLDSSAPEPKKKSVRKPRAKPPPKSAAPVQERSKTAEQNLKDKESAVAQMPASENTLKKSRPENAAHVSSPGTLNQKKNLNNTDRPAASTVSPVKQAQTKENIIPSIPREETTDETASEPKRKKKKKKENETQENVERNVAETVGKDIKTKKTEIKELQDVEKTKGEKTETEEDMMEKTENIVEDDSESEVREKKAKKKKKEKTRCEENSADTVEETIVKKKKKKPKSEENTELNSSETINTHQTVTNPNEVGNEERLEEKVQQKKAKRKKEMAISEENLELGTVEVQENTEQSVEDDENPESIVKKKKKKKRESVDGETNPEEVVQEMKAKKKKKEKNPDEVISEQIDEKKTKKKEMAISEENLELGTVEVQENTEQSVEDDENPESIVRKKKAKKKKRESVDGETNPEEVVQEMKAKKKKEKNPDEVISEQIDDKADHKDVTSKKKSATETIDCNERQEDLEHKSADTDLLDPSSLETTSPPKKKKKKKKSKLQSEEVLEEAVVSAQDVTATQTPPADSRRKKKKSKSPES